MLNMSKSIEKFKTLSSSETVIDQTFCSVIMTFYNYSEFVKEALKSIQNQTHPYFECVIVDDASSENHATQLQKAVEELSDKRFRILTHKKNMGQTPAIFSGLSATSGMFVGLIDPDDVYHPEFLATMLRAHLNDRVIASVASCEMGVFESPSKMISKRSSSFYTNDQNERERRRESLLEHGYSVFVPAWQPGWHWAATSSMMFRRDALEAIRPLDYPAQSKFHGDAYCGHGGHMIGGTLFVDKLLSWRRVHSSNTARVGVHLHSKQFRLKKDFIEIDYTSDLKKLAIQTFFQRQGAHHFDIAALGEILTAHFNQAELEDLAETCTEIRDLLYHYAVNVTWDQIPAETQLTLSERAA